MEGEVNNGVAHAFDFSPVLIFLLAAVIFVPLFQRIKVSPVLAYLVGGAAIGPFALGLIEDLETTQHIAEFGVIFLLFAIGLELSFDRLIAMRREVFGLGSCQVLVTGTIIGGIAYASGTGIDIAIIVGGGLAFSSTAMVMQILNEHGELSTRAGRTTFSILLLQDLAVVPLLALVPLLAEEGQHIASALGLAGLKAAAALIGLTVIGRLVLRPIYRVVAGTRKPELFVGVTLLVVLGTSWATAQTGLSLALGAFLAGLLLSETEYVHQIEADIEPFRGLFLGLFFISVGMAIDFQVIADRLGTVIVLVIALILIKTIVIIALCRLFGFRPALSVRCGTNLAQGGEFGFVLFGLAVAVGVMTLATGQILVVVIGLTMALTPAVMIVGNRIAHRLEHARQSEQQLLSEEAADLEGYVLVAGFGRVGQTVAHMLRDHAIPYLALDLDQRVVAEGRAQGFPVYFGNAGRATVLKAAGIERASGAVVTLDNPEAALRAVETLHQYCPHGTIIVRARDQSHSDSLKAAGASTVVPEILEASLQLAGQALRTFGIPLEVVDGSLDALRTKDYAEVEKVITGDHTPTPTDAAANKSKG